MLDKVLDIDKKNEKALYRKATCLVETADYPNAEKVVREIEDIAFQSQDKVQNALYKKVKELRQKINRNSKEEEEFSKKIF